MLFFSITAQAQKVLIEDANVEVRELTGSFDRIKVSGGIQLYLSQDEETKVAVSSSEADVVAGIRASGRGYNARVEQVLRDAGVTDFSQYLVTPGSEPMLDLYIDA